MDFFMMDFMNNLFPLMFLLVFLLVAGTIVVTLIRSIHTWHNNNQAPRLEVEATVVGKRTQVSTRGGGSQGTMHHSSSTYYVTFQVASGDRMELQLSGTEYGLLAEGDRGMLQFQGTRYLGFRRS